MGNQPSKVDEFGRGRDEPRRAQKLSKPRTNNYGSSTAPSRSHSAAPRTSRMSLPLTVASTQALSVITSAAGDQPTVAAEKPVRPKARKRLSLFRSKSAHPDQSLEEDRRMTQSSNALLTKVPDVSRPVSAHIEPVTPAKSATYDVPAAEPWPRPASRTSWSYDMQSYDAQRLYSLETEDPLEQSVHLSMNGDDEQTEVSHATWKSSHPPESTSLSRANSDLSMHIPHRRRSMAQTPGVATRTRPSAQCLPAHYRHSYYGQVPSPYLSRQASFESDHGLEMKMTVQPPKLALPTEDACAAATPDVEYSATGAFKLGSLRIVNGSPARTPDVRRARGNSDQSESTPKAQDYLTAGSRLAPSYAGALESSQTAADTVTSKQPSDSDSQVSDTVTTLLGAHDGLLPPLPATAPMLDPLRPQSPLWAGLEVTSKHTAFEDRLFAAEPAQASLLQLPTEDILQIRVDPNAKVLPPRPVDEATNKRLKMERSDSGIEVGNRPVNRSESTLAKADSGYSSVRSMKKDKKSKTKDENARRKSVADLMDNSQILPKSVPTIVNTAGAIRDDAELQAPTPPPKDDPASTTSTPRTSTSQRFSSPASGLSTPRASSYTILSPVSLDKELPSPTMSAASLGSLTSSVCQTPTSTRSGFSDKALNGPQTAPRTKMLKRLLSRSGQHATKPPLEVHTTHIVQRNQVPQIPQDVRNSLHDRVGMFPMTTQRLTVKQHASKETLKTIFSVGSLEIGNDSEDSTTEVSLVTESEVTSSVTAVPEVRTSRHSLPSMQFKLNRAVTMPQVVTQKPIIRKPVPARRDVTKVQVAPVVPSEQPTPMSDADGLLALEAEITSYSSINSSLGNNPYDAAISAMAGGIPAWKPAPAQRELSGSPMASFRSAQSSPNLQRLSLDIAPSRTDADAQWSQGPFAMSTPTKTRSPPPVSLVTRQPTSSGRPGPSPISSNSSNSPRLGRGDLAKFPPRTSHPLPRPGARNSFDSLRTARVVSDPVRSPPGWSARHSSFGAQMQYQDPAAHKAPGSEGSPEQHEQQEGPFRILHSYNSPAYRGVPIWA